jgi:hypothetical protein
LSEQLDFLSPESTTPAETTRGAEIKLRYPDWPEGQFHTVYLIYSWNRGDIQEAIMSASSGPKDYMRNEIFMLFEKAPHVDRIVMLRGRGPTFYLFRQKLDTGPVWFDITGKQVIEA